MDLFHAGRDAVSSIPGAIGSTGVDGVGRWTELMGLEEVPLIDPHESGDPSM